MKITVDGQGHEVERGRDNVTVDETVFRTTVEGDSLTRTVYVNDFSYRVELPEDHSGSALTVTVDGRPHTVEVEGKLRGGSAPAPRPSAQPKRGPAPAGAVVSAMAGRIVTVHVEVGQQVQEGDVLLVLEAMKMENDVKAPKDGVVKQVAVAAGSRVNEGDVLVAIG